MQKKEELVEEAKMIEKSAAWWIDQTQKILDEIDEIEASPYYENKHIDLDRLYSNLKTFLGRKKIEENKINNFIKKIDTIKDNHAKD